MPPPPKTRPAALRAWPRGRVADRPGLDLRLRCPRPGSGPRARRTIEVIIEPNADPAAFVSGFAVARLHDGSMLRVDINSQLGAPEAALDPAQHRTKVSACLAFAGLDCSADALAETVTSIEYSEDIIASLRATGLS